MRTFLRIIAACCVMALTGLTVFAQTDRVVISGTVKSESGDPLVGASVIVKGATTRGTIVEVDGTYSISAAEGETLVYDCLGFVSQEVKLTGKSRIDIVMIEDTNFLDETIVVGYAPMRKSDFTGSIASVKSDELQKSTATVGQALVGRVAGVEIRQSNGAPGAGVNIRVRGVNSLTASTSPLLVVLPASFSSPPREDVTMKRLP